MALERLGADFEHYRAIEFDKYAMASYNAVHGTSFEPTDICDVTGKDLNIIHTYIHTYMVTYSFPCQSLSLAGKQAGMAKGSGTRSGLLWEVERLRLNCGEAEYKVVVRYARLLHQKIREYAKWKKTRITK